MPMKSKQVKVKKKQPNRSRSRLEIMTGTYLRLMDLSKVIGKPGSRIVEEYVDALYTATIYATPAIETPQLASKDAPTLK